MRTWAFAILVMALGGCVEATPESDAGDEDVGEADLAATRPGTPILARTCEIALLLSGNFDTAGRLYWNDSTTSLLRGGNHFVTPYKAQVLIPPSVFTRVISAGEWLGQPASMIKSLSGRTAPVSTWSKGPRVLASCGSIPVGTAVGTFYGPSGGFGGHVGFLAACGGGKITLWDQGFARPPDGVVRKHSLSNTAANTPQDAAAYFVVLAPL